jgi:hypothetical protein
MIRGTLMTNFAFFFRKGLENQSLNRPTLLENFSLTKKSFEPQRLTWFIFALKKQDFLARFFAFVCQRRRSFACKRTSDQPCDKRLHLNCVSLEIKRELWGISVVASDADTSGGW